MKIYHFHISGTHCSACKIFIEETLKEQDFAHDVHVDLGKKTLELATHIDQSPEALAKLMTKKIESHGYAVSVEREADYIPKNEVFWKALPIGLGFLVLFFLLQKSGILNIGLGGQVTPVTSLLIGIIASVSSCLAIVGGLVLSLSAKLSQEGRGSEAKTVTLFHVGRLVSFGLLGGFLGAMGSVLAINFTLAAALGLLASVVMILLGLNLVGAIKKNATALPAGAFAFLRRIEHKTLAPFALGVATFFLPCGFTQSMQISAVSSGSFMAGLLIMLSFAVGTLPMLAFLSFGSASFARGKHAPLFFASAGVVVIGLGLFAFLSGLAGLGIIRPLVNL
jgi:sulfite exporter TauE/SafE/copper chaperone CopZ